MTLHDTQQWLAEFTEKWDHVLSRSTNVSLRQSRYSAYDLPFTELPKLSTVEFIDQALEPASTLHENLNVTNSLFSNYEIEIEQQKEEIHSLENQLRNIQEKASLKLKDLFVENEEIKKRLTNLFEKTNFQDIIQVYLKRLEELQEKKNRVFRLEVLLEVLETESPSFETLRKVEKKLEKALEDERENSDPSVSKRLSMSLECLVNIVKQNEILEEKAWGFEEGSKKVKKDIEESSVKLVEMTDENVRLKEKLKEQKSLNQKLKRIREKPEVKTEIRKIRDGERVFKTLVELRNMLQYYKDYRNLEIYNKLYSNVKILKKELRESKTKIKHLKSSIDKLKSK